MHDMQASALFGCSLKGMRRQLAVSDEDNGALVQFIPGDALRKPRQTNGSEQAIEAAATTAATTTCSLRAPVIALAAASACPVWICAGYKRHEDFA